MFDSSHGFSVRGVMRHELGHVLGFRHEHIRDEVPKGLFVPEDTSSIAPQGPWDKRSVMHYPNAAADLGTMTLEFTDHDRYHAWQIYKWTDGRGPTANPYDEG